MLYGYLCDDCGFIGLLGIPSIDYALIDDTSIVTFLVSGSPGSFSSIGGLFSIVVFSSIAYRLGIWMFLIGGYPLIAIASMSYSSIGIFSIVVFFTVGSLMVGSFIVHYSVFSYLPMPDTSIADIGITDSFIVDSSIVDIPIADNSIADTSTEDLLLYMTAFTFIAFPAFLLGAQEVCSILHCIRAS